MELRFIIPTNGYKGISIRYALQTSDSTYNGAAPHTEMFDYSVDGGTTWKTTGLMVNGTAGSSLNVHQPQYGSPGTGTGNFGPVSIGFGTETSMDNNSKFIFRIKFADSTHGTSGNNRFDNISVTAASLAPAGVANVSQAHPLSIYPNPVQNLLSFENPFESQVSVSVIDMMGREVLNSHANALSHLDLNTTELPAGTYLLRVQAGENGMSDVKFVKQ